MGCGATTQKKYVVELARPASEAHTNGQQKSTAATVSSAATASSKAEPDAAAKGARAIPMESDPEALCLFYHEFAGRGELARLIAAVGGLKLNEYSELSDKSSFASPSVLPCLQHGTLKLSQSFAIEHYLMSIAPAFKDLTLAQRAADYEFCKMKEEMMAGFLNIIMSEDESYSPINVVSDMVEIGDKWLSIIEDRLPQSGFINGLASPTVADLAVLNVAKAFMPFGAAYLLCDYDAFGKFPKFSSLVDRIAITPAVKAYLEQSISMDADPLELRDVVEGAGEASARMSMWTTKSINFKRIASP